MLGVFYSTMTPEEVRKARKAESDRKYREKNKEKIEERKKKWTELNKERVSERKRKWYLENKGRIKERLKSLDKANPERKRQACERASKWYKSNKERHREWYIRWCKENPEKKKKYAKKWAENNPTNLAKNRHLRRAREVGAAGTFNETQLKARFDYYGNKCYYCGRGGKMTVEHRIPLSRGGSNWPANLVPACWDCNQSKNNKTEAEFLTFIEKRSTFLRDIRRR